MTNTEFYDRHLRAFPDSGYMLDHEDVPFFGSLPDFLRSIKRSFGIEIMFVRAGARLPDLMSKCFTVKVEGGKVPGSLVLLPSDEFSDKVSVPVSEQESFVGSLALLLGEAYRWQQLFRKYEEELASIVPIPTIDPSETKFTETLFNILKSGAKILDCQAASLYILNASEKELKLRSCWGLPEERLLEPPRLLHDSLADIEAMLGQVVILNEDYLFDAWQSPELFPTAVCVPVTSPVNIIGTLWFFADVRRDFSDRDTHLIEIIAGRIAAELERVAMKRELAKKNAG
ncbi:MAG: GAF domain-containing protein [Planctomycetaceae bacterium]|jgi:hypothetical protein|nr:GAF domain-containing protein [Planctomycetaceae bacterium]